MRKFIPEFVTIHRALTRLIKFDRTRVAEGLPAVAGLTSTAAPIARGTT